MKRRQYLLGGTVALTSGLAGCASGLLSSDGEGSGDEGTLPTWSEWLSAGVGGQSNDPAVIHVDVEQVAEWPSDPQTPIAVTEYMSRTGIEEAGTPTSALELSTGEGKEQSHVVLFGSFDPGTFDDHVTGVYGDFQAIADSAAVRSDTFIVSDQYEQLIDAKAGEAERVTDADESWVEAIAAVYDSVVSHAIVPESDPKLAWAAQGIDVADGRVLQDTFYQFSDEEEAETHYPEIVENNDDPNTEVSREGTLVRVEYDVAHDEVLRTENVLVIRNSVVIEYYPHDY